MRIIVIRKAGMQDVGRVMDAADHACRHTLFPQMSMMSHYLLHSIEADPLPEAFSLVKNSRRGFSWRGKGHYCLLYRLFLQSRPSTRTSVVISYDVDVVIVIVSRPRLRLIQKSSQGADKQLQWRWRLCLRLLASLLLLLLLLLLLGLLLRLPDLLRRLRRDPSS